jgi:hypothetical protein
MKYLLRREMMSAAASISTAAALRSQIKLDGRFWPIAKFSVKQSSAAIGAWRTSSKPHPVQFG